MSECRNIPKCVFKNLTSLINIGSSGDEYLLHAVATVVQILYIANWTAMHKRISTLFVVLVLETTILEKGKIMKILFKGY